jgi:tetratricopeptide (TPR) repeat protein
MQLQASVLAVIEQQIAGANISFVQPDARAAESRKPRQHCDHLCYRGRVVKGGGAHWRTCRVLACRGLLLAALSSCSDRIPDGECQRAYRAYKWDEVLATCKGERWGDRQQLAKGALLQRQEEEALAILDPLLSSSEAAEAAFFSGYIRFNSDNPELRKLARVRWEKALELFKRADDPMRISNTAMFLAHDPRPEFLFDDVLKMAQLAVAEGERSKDPRTRGRALAALAEAYDVIGMERVARDHFVRAEELLQPWPDQMSQTFLKHGSFLLDAATTTEALEAALALYDTAERYCEAAESEGNTALVAKNWFAILLNRADALSQLGRHDEAKRALDEAIARADKDPVSSSQQARIHQIAGYLSARLRKPEEAEQHFLQAALDQEEEVFDVEYQWLARYELALAYRATGQHAQAEAALRTAIATIESQRQRATQLELRPWVLAHRSSPHRELFTLLVELGRHDEALAVAESLHARAWLDAVLSPHPDGTPHHAATAAAARALLAAKSTPPPTPPELMAALADREALVYLVINSAIWRAHVRDGAVTFQQLPPSAAKLISELRANPDAPSRAKASSILLPANLSRSREPLYIVAHGEPGSGSSSGSGVGADLAAFPFAALLLDGRPIIATRPIARLPGLAALRCRSSTWDARAVFLGNAPPRTSDPRPPDRSSSQPAAQISSTSPSTASPRCPDKPSTSPTPSPPPPTSSPPASARASSC